MPDLLVALVKRLVRWGVLPAKMAPDTAIINIYDQVLLACIPHALHRMWKCQYGLLAKKMLPCQMIVAVKALFEGASTVNVNTAVLYH